MSIEDGTQDKEVLELKRKLSQCQLERERLINETNRWTIKEKLLKRELENVEEKLSAEKEADLNARSEFKKTEETLREALETKNNSVRQHNDELIDKRREIFQCPLSPKDNAKFNRLSDDLQKNSLQSREKAEKLLMLSSEMQKKRQELYGFQETFLKNFKNNPTADLTLLRNRFSACFDTLKICGHGYKMQNEFMYFILRLDAAKRENEKSAAVDFKSSISAGVSKNSSGAVVDETSYVGKMLRYMIGKIIWNKGTI